MKFLVVSVLLSYVCAMLGVLPPPPAKFKLPTPPVWPSHRVSLDMTVSALDYTGHVVGRGIYMEADPRYSRFKPMRRLTLQVLEGKRAAVVGWGGETQNPQVILRSLSDGVTAFSIGIGGERTTFWAVPPDAIPKIREGKQEIIEALPLKVIKFDEKTPQY